MAKKLSQVFIYQCWNESSRLIREVRLHCVPRILRAYNTHSTYTTLGTNLLGLSKKFVCSVFLEYFVHITHTVRTPPSEYTLRSTHTLQTLHSLHSLHNTLTPHTTNEKNKTGSGRLFAAGVFDSAAPLL